MQSMSLPFVADDTIRKLVHEIDTRGFCCLPNFIPPGELAAMRQFVDAAIGGSKGEYVGFTGRAAVEGSAFDTLSTSEAFRSLMRRVYEIGTGEPAPAIEFHQVLRCLSGASGQRHSLRFHYDSYLVTALVPVEIPTTGRTGDLIMLPNTRGIRSSYLVNLIDKILLDNAFTQVVLGALTKFGLLPLVRIRPKPGDIYLFWGYRSIHTNEACDPDKVRATALFHYANPHAEVRSKLKLMRARTT